MSGILLSDFQITRRAVLAGTAALGLAAFSRSVRAVPAFEPAANLVSSARKDGRLVLYTSSVASAVQDTIRAFNLRFPFITFDLVRASGSQLITRVQAEAKNGLLKADVIDHSDRALLKRLEPIFQEYAPPNGGDYLPAAVSSRKLWPTIAPGWCIASHAELQKNPPRTWADLATPAYGGGQIGQVIGISGGTTWTRILFERKVLGADYWRRQAAQQPRLFPSSAPLADALVRGEVTVAPLIYDAVFPLLRDGAPLRTTFAPEGVPIAPYATGIPKTAQHPSAARLFLDWLLSPEGQHFAVTRRGTFSLLKTPPALPEGFNPHVHKTWLPDFGESERLHDAWVREWTRTYNYRQ